jgi:hypothetical protein
MVAPYRKDGQLKYVLEKYETEPVREAAFPLPASNVFSASRGVFAKYKSDNPVSTRTAPAPISQCASSETHH